MIMAVPYISIPAFLPMLGVVPGFIVGILIKSCSINLPNVTLKYLSQARREYRMPTIMKRMPILILFIGWS